MIQDSCRESVTKNEPAREFIEGLRQALSFPRPHHEVAAPLNQTKRGRLAKGGEDEGGGIGRARRIEQIDSQRLIVIAPPAEAGQRRHDVDVTSGGVDSPRVEALVDIGE